MAKLIIIEGGRVASRRLHTVGGINLLKMEPEIQDPMVNLVFEDMSYLQYIVSQDLWEQIKVAAYTGESWESAASKLADQIVKGYLLQELAQGYNPPDFFPEKRIDLRKRSRDTEYIKLEFDKPSVYEDYRVDVKEANAARLQAGGKSATPPIIEVKGATDAEKAD